MKGSKSFLNCLFPFLSLLFLNGCGLQYTPPKTTDNPDFDRKQALEQQLKTDYLAIQKKYTPLAYGNLVVEKPMSYLRLDSLFERKYTLSQSGIRSEELDFAIENQQMIALNDSLPILYVETHWFQLQQDSTFEYITAECALNKANKLSRIKIIDYFETDAADSVYAKKYMKEEGFSTTYTFATAAELDFYAYMKTYANSLIEPEKKAFLHHVFSLMAIADKDNNLTNEHLLMRLTEKLVLKKYAFLTAEKVGYIVNYVMLADNDSKQPDYIEVQTIKAGENIAFDVFKFNLFLQPLRN